MLTNSSAEFIPIVQDYMKVQAHHGHSDTSDYQWATDKCCQHAPDLSRGAPGSHTCLDLHHLNERLCAPGIYANDSNNDMAKLVRSRITDCLQKTRRTDDAPAEYYSQAEQTVKFAALYQELENRQQLTQEGHRAWRSALQHIRQGCMSRKYSNLPSDSSRCEEFFKDLNKPARGTSSSLGSVHDAAHDTILRSNVSRPIARNLSQPANSNSRLFKAALNGSHHVGLLNDLHEAENRYLGTRKPILRDPCPEIRFGLVNRNL